MNPVDSVADFAQEFIRRAKAGEKPSIVVSRQHAETFLAVLADEGFGFARECLAQIADADLRAIIETIFFSTAAGAAIGATIGAIAAGEKGAKVGALIGGTVGVTAACIAVTVRAREKNDGLLLSAE